MELWRVARSGDASYSSKFGYSHEIEFIGSAFRGNIGELVWDTLSCEAFDSPSNDARVQIATNNDSLAVGTDTARTQILIESTGGVDIVEGSYQLSVNYLGGVQITSCIDWDASAQKIEQALEALENIDSVLVDLDDTIVAVADNDNNSLEPSTFQRRFNIYFDGHAMHTDGSNAFAGFDPTQGSNFDVIIGASSSCNSFKAFKDNVLTDFESIDDAEARVTIESTYRGGPSTLSAVASDLSIHDVASSLLDAMPMHFDSSNILVAQSLEDDEKGVTYTLTFGEDNGNVPGLVCNGDEDLLLLETATCTAQTVMDGNALGGYFYVDSSEPIPHDASAAQVEAAIEGMNGIDNVSVTRSEPDGQEGYSWDVTFLSTLLEELVVGVVEMSMSWLCTPPCRAKMRPFKYEKLLRVTRSEGHLPSRMVATPQQNPFPLMQMLIHSRVLFWRATWASVKWKSPKTTLQWIRKVVGPFGLLLWTMTAILLEVTDHFCMPTHRNYLELVP